MFSIYKRTRWREVVSLARARSASPVYVLNLLHYRNFSAYRWYGLFVYPMIRFTGGMPVWVGKHAESIHGQQRFGNLLIVRYPSHRRFLAMVFNPYYALINELREAGVDSFEAAFSAARGRSKPEHIEARYLIGVHGNPASRRDLDRLCAELRGAGLEPALELQEYAPLPPTDPVQPTDPKPYTNKINIFFPLPDPAALEALQPKLQRKAGPCEVHLYQASPRREYLPGGALPEWAHTG